MMKKLLSAAFMVVAYTTSFAQVGINTPTPASTLDLVAKNATGTSRNVDGLLVPRVDRQRALSMTSIPTSTLIYVNSVATGTQTGIAANIDTVGYYYFDSAAWIKLTTNGSPLSMINLYNSDGTLIGNRTVTQNDKTLAFTGTATNAFSVDGSTFSVDAANHRVGVGTRAPEHGFHVVTTTPSANRFSMIDAPEGTNEFVTLALRNTSPLATNNRTLLGFTNSGPTSGGANWGLGTIRTGNTDTAGNQEEFILGNSQGSTYNERLRVTSNGNIGVGTPTPSSSAILDLTSNNKGFLPPRLTTAQRDAINPKPAGLVVYNTTNNCLEFWNSATWVSTCGGTAPGTITTLNCSGASNTGTLTSGAAASGVTSSIPYTGGNGGSYGGQAVSSTGVTGLTATLSPGNFGTGSGSVTYTITGTPSGPGIANFAISVGGQSCTLSLNVNGGSGTITFLNCGGAVLNGTLRNGYAVSGVTITVPYSGGNGGPYNGQSVNSTGVTGLTATLVPGNFAAGNGNLTYTVTGTPVGEGTASFAISVGGQACTVNVTVQPAVSPSNNYCVDKGLPDGNYVYPGYVQRYIKCITISGTKYTQPYTCPSGSGFNPNTKLCEVGYGAPYN